MIPVGGDIRDVSEQEVQPSYTWKLDLEKGRITNMIDGLEAVKQSVFKMLQSKRFHHMIYSFDYGNEMYSLIGKNPAFVKSEVTRIIREALRQDDRIQGIENLQITITEDSLLAQITVMTTFGSFEFSQEVVSGV